MLELLAEDVYVTMIPVKPVAKNLCLLYATITAYRLCPNRGRSIVCDTGLWLISAGGGTVAKLAMRQPFVLFKGLTFQKLCLPGAFRPGDHHNKMLRPGLCVVHASPQYL